MFELVAADLPSRMVEDHGARAGGALVDCCNEVGHSSMMDHVGSKIIGSMKIIGNNDIAGMPRGGPGASCLDRLLQTDRQEYLDRDSDGDADLQARKRSVIRALDWTGEFFGNHEKFAKHRARRGGRRPRSADPGTGRSGHGGLSRKLLEMHPTARLTVTDVEADSVAAIAAGDLGAHPRARIRKMDATAHRRRRRAVRPGGLRAVVPPPAPGQPPPRVFAEGTRAANKLLIIDLPRPPAPLHLLRLATMLPFAPFVPFVHDGVISSLRAYSPSALAGAGRPRRSRPSKSSCAAGGQSASGGGHPALTGACRAAWATGNPGRPPVCCG